MLIRAQSWIHAARRLTARTVDMLLVGAVLTMVLVATAQIVARNFFDAGLLWADPLLRILVLWTALLGAVVAARRNKHITVDVFSRFLPPRWQLSVGLVTQLFTAAVCAFLAWHAGRFVALEREGGTKAVADVPTWVVELILPIALALITLRYLGHAFSSARRIFKGAGTPLS